MIPFSVGTILLVIALLLVIFSFFASQYPLLQVAVLLVIIALLAGQHALK